MNQTITISNTDVYKAIWLDNNSKRGAAADFLRTFLPARKSKVSTVGVNKLAVVVGHNSKKPGAYASGLINKSEFVLNSAVAKRMVELADSDPSIEIKVFYRKPLNSYSAQIKDVYKRVNAWLESSSHDTILAYELHFNWLAGAGRIEMLHYPNSSYGIKASNILLDKTKQVISGSTKLVPRGASDRGGLSLASCKAPCVMTETFDCSNDTHLAEVAEIGSEGIAQINFSAAKEYFN